MEQKRVSFETAKALKEAGYPQKCHGYTKEGYKVNPYILSDERTEYAAPTYLDVWLWLWNEKKIYILLNNGAVVSMQGEDLIWHIVYQNNHSNHEEAIIAAIEYLVDNDLIKNKE